MSQSRRDTSRSSDVERHPGRIPAVVVVMLLLGALVFPTWQLTSPNPCHAANVVSTHGKAILQITPELGAGPPENATLRTPLVLYVQRVLIAEMASDSLLFGPDLHNRPPPEFA